MIADSIYIILIFGLLGVVTNGIGWKRGFYEWKPLIAPRVLFTHVFFIFAIYVGSTFFLLRYFLALVQNYSGGNPPFEMVISIQFLVIIAMLAGIFLYCRTQAKGVFAGAWKNPSQPIPTSPLFDFLLGVSAWFLAFPVVQIVGQFFDLALFIIYRLESYEQVAVKYLKTTLESPLLTVLALVSIVIIAPVIEEFLFRGTLQNYFKRHLGAKKAIVFSAVCFAFFHYSSEQGLGNLSLIPSLFTFACFLGYIYERQGSLYASIGLHMTFNFVSSVRILLSPE